MFIEIIAMLKTLKSILNFFFNKKRNNIIIIYKKGLMKNDIIAGKSNVYYYTDVNKGEEREVLVNFKTGEKIFMVE